MFVHTDCVTLAYHATGPEGVWYLLTFADGNVMGVHEHEIEPVIDSVVGSRCTYWAQTTPENARDFLAVGERVVIDD